MSVRKQRHCWYSPYSASCLLWHVHRPTRCTSLNKFQFTTLLRVSAVFTRHHQGVQTLFTDTSRLNASLWCHLVVVVLTLKWSTKRKWLVSEVQRSVSAATTKWCHSEAFHHDESVKTFYTFWWWRVKILNEKCTELVGIHVTKSLICMLMSECKKNSVIAPPTPCL